MIPETLPVTFPVLGYSIVPTVGKVKQNLWMMTKMGETHKKCLRLVDKMTNDRRKCVLNSKLMRCLYRFMNGFKSFIRCNGHLKAW